MSEIVVETVKKNYLRPSLGFMPKDFNKTHCKPHSIA
jgi:hypothetical protein